MSSEHHLPGSDIRGAAQDYKRDAAHKAKYALGAKVTRGRTEATPRPRKPSEIYNHRRIDRTAAATVSAGSKAKMSRKLDVQAAGDEYNVSSEENSNASCESDTNDTDMSAPTEVLYGVNNSTRAPGHGSQILNTALAKAIEQYEDKETTKLVRNEYEILDADEETGHVSAPRPKLMDAEDAEYEFV